MMAKVCSDVCLKLSQGLKNTTPNSGGRYAATHAEMTYDIGWYFEQVLATTPAEYLGNKWMYNEGFVGVTLNRWPPPHFFRQIYMLLTEYIELRIVLSQKYIGHG